MYLFPLLSLPDVADVDAEEEQEESDDELGGLFKVLKKASGDGSRQDKQAVNKRDCNHLDGGVTADLEQVEDVFFFSSFFFHITLSFPVMGVGFFFL